MDQAMSARGEQARYVLRTDRLAFWTSSTNEVLLSLGARPEGLTSAEASKRMARYGANLVVTTIRRGFIVKLARRLAEPLVAILLIAAAFSGATGDWQSFIIIIIIVLFSITLDMVQEQKAEIRRRRAQKVGRRQGYRPP